MKARHPEGPFPKRSPEEWAEAGLPPDDPEPFLPNGEEDYVPLGEPNGEAKPPKHFELTAFDAIRLDTTPAYLVVRHEPTFRTH